MCSDNISLKKLQASLFSCTIISKGNFGFVDIQVVQRDTKPSVWLHGMRLDDPDDPLQWFVSTEKKIEAYQNTTRLLGLWAGFKKRVEEEPLHTATLLINYCILNNSYKT